MGRGAAGQGPEHPGPPVIGFRTSEGQVVFDKPAGAFMVLVATRPTTYTPGSSVLSLVQLLSGAVALCGQQLGKLLFTCREEETRHLGKESNNKDRKETEAPFQTTSLAKTSDCKCTVLCPP
ncbi:hypothetical protein Cadr_000009867 [Camelus dromedarius]|uniref:Uncharacterized protein n=1 Tax=Camelus dromedarius TaxID=9838 RepID=A0A5N4DWE2_CAMDR|nr:hypothetical protein Cadr_000009867 [Camelus dromedarius]